MLTSGFYDSIEHDRRYNAEQMSAIFDGIINDGVLINVGNGFMVSQGTGYEIKIGIGRAWFDSTWIYNDNVYLLECPEPELLMDRIDAVVIEVNREDTVREAFIKIVSGEPAASNPPYPELIDTEYVHQHPIAYIYRNANETEILQSQITYNVGTEECPFVTGLLEVMTIDAIVAQWDGEFHEWWDVLYKILDDDVAGHLALEIAQLKTLTEVTLSSSGWSSSFPYTQTVTVNGVTSETAISDLGIMYPTNCSDDNRKAISKAAAYIYDVESTDDGTVIFRATQKPTTSFTVGFRGVF